MSTVTRTMTGGGGVLVAVGVAVGGPGVSVGNGVTGGVVGSGGGVAVTMITTTVCTAGPPAGG
ncbi:MAG: hypothetical protein CVU38_05360 [Chloroflexi bacterium HGW-Chloroflexi-1]|nr:MAG: hypothetical protein CVU38_05360 [Chloroflexi bacterium HGW-Chloroflexi-1]